MILRFLLGYVGRRQVGLRFFLKHRDASSVSACECICHPVLKLRKTVEVGQHRVLKLDQGKDEFLEGS